MKGKNLKLIGEIIFLIILYLLINSFSSRYQKIISYNEHKGWDGEHFYKTAQSFINGEKPSGRAPFIYRIGTPYIVSRLYNSENLIKGFSDINKIAAFLYALLLYIWIRDFISGTSVRILLMFLFLSQWHNWIRLVYFYPVHVDPWAQVFIMAGLLIMTQISDSKRDHKDLILAAVVFAGTFFRETVLLIPVIYLINSLMNSKKRTTTFTTYLPLLAGATAFIITHTTVNPTNHYMFPAAALYWIYYKPVLQFLHGWAASYGPILIIPLFFYERSLAILKNNRLFALLLAIILILSWIGGGDTERYAYWAAPVVLVVLGKILENDDVKKFIKKAPTPFLSIIPLQLISQRIFWIIPDYPPQNKGFAFTFLTVWSNEGDFHNLFAVFGEYKTVLISFSSYVAVFVILWIWLYYKRKQTS